MEKVEVERLCQSPDALWKKLFLKNERVCFPVPARRLDEPIVSNAVRFVCIADTHERLSDIVGRIPNGDVLIHAGDITNFGEREQLMKFNDIVGELPHKYKIVIAGNHDLGFEDDEDESQRAVAYKGRGTSRGYKLLTNCIYLQDSEVELYGIRVYGSSWHPLPGYSFSRSRGQDLLNKWNLVPKNTDILITHTPPLGHGDNFKGERWGCSELLNTVEKRVQPKFHVFGHVHEQNGITSNGVTTFINASICNHQLDPISYPIIFDLPLPSGKTKD